YAVCLHKQTATCLHLVFAWQRYPNSPSFPPSFDVPTRGIGRRESPQEFQNYRNDDVGVDELYE
ncbi:10675_t:CDS:2, partial [Dentiscutata heterogama]